MFFQELKTLSEARLNTLRQALGDIRGPATGDAGLHDDDDDDDDDSSNVHF